MQNDNSIVQEDLPRKAHVAIDFLYLMVKTRRISIKKPFKS